MSDRRYLGDICSCGDAFCAGCEEPDLCDSAQQSVEPTISDDGGSWADYKYIKAVGPQIFGGSR